MTAAKFKDGDRVRKIKGSRWQGKVVGFYQTALNPEGYAVESETEKGSVQIYPAAALERVPAERIYISGPMTGIEDNNFPAFNKAADLLRKSGWDVVNPADHGVIDGASWSDYLRLDLAQLVQCTDIYFLRGWTESKGAALEYLVAQELGIRMSFAPDAEV